MKKSEFRLPCGGSSLGLRKAQPLASASRGAGPSYGKDRPTKTCVQNGDTHIQHALHNLDHTVSDESRKPGSTSHSILGKFLSITAALE